MTNDEKEKVIHRNLKRWKQRLKEASGDSSPGASARRAGIKQRIEYWQKGGPYN